MTATNKLPHSILYAIQGMVFKHVHPTATILALLYAYHHKQYTVSFIPDLSTSAL